LARQGSEVVAVVVSHDSAQLLPRCIQALMQQQIAVVVVDNASRDGSVEAARGAGARVIANEKNEGYGRANNQGVRAADGAEWCLITNPDVTVEPDCLAKLVEAAHRHPRAAIVVPRLTEQDGRIAEHSTSVLSRVSSTSDVDEAIANNERVVQFVSGACLLVRRDAFLNVGGFDERIFLFYEDDDLCLRLRKAGFILVMVDDAFARHGRGKSSAAARGRIFRSRWHQAWSRSYVCRKHGVADDSLVALIRNGLKWLAVLPTFNRRHIERYAGSAAGAWAALRNRSALERERLE
jgi:N-acetylglucosaminyl-diphospho-decaprenol L-rhamnosyltransferase